MFIQLFSFSSVGYLFVSAENYIMKVKNYIGFLWSCMFVLVVENSLLLKNKKRPVLL